jgi:regulator of protease activity HflC (stomatin/prohibitin superfamily)
MQSSITPPRVVLAALAFVLVCGLLVGSCAGVKSYNRYQKRADAKNDVKVTSILIQKATQQARINRAEIAATKAEAEKRYQESIGLKRAQDEIRKTLTPLYVQHEFVQALEMIARSGSNNSTVFLPTGAGGLPSIVPQVSATKGR